LAAWKAFARGDGSLRTIDLGTIRPLEHLGTTSASPDSADANDPVAKAHGLVPRNRFTHTASLAQPDAPGLRLRFSDAAPLARSEALLEAGSQPSHFPHGLMYFACAAGVGLDGEISRRANALPRWLRAHGGYALSLPPALLAFQPFSITLSVAQPGRAQILPGSQQSVMAAVFANTPVYGGGMRVAPGALMDDALLDVCVIRDMAKLKLLSVFPSVYLGRHLNLREVEYFTAPSARIETNRPIDVYADGEYVCPTPVEISVASRALPVIVPARKDSQEF
jgi:hypothetical protein